MTSPDAFDQQTAAVELPDVIEPECSGSSSSSGVGPNIVRMLEAIDGLPTDEREAFELVRIQGLTQPEAAEVVGVSAKTIKRRLDRGLALLTRMLGDLLTNRARSETSESTETS